MRRRQHEYSVAELLDHPVLGLLMTGTGIEHRAVALLVGPVVQMKEATLESRDWRILRNCGQGRQFSVLTTQRRPHGMPARKTRGFIRGRLWHRSTPDRAELPAADKIPGPRPRLAAIAHRPLKSAQPAAGRYRGRRRRSFHP